MPTNRQLEIEMEIACAKLAKVIENNREERIKQAWAIMATRSTQKDEMLKRQMRERRM